MATEDDAVSAILSNTNGSNEKTNDLNYDGFSGDESDGSSSLLFQSQEVLSKKNEELSEEDAAWADSCLAFGSEELSDGNWQEIREALLETLSTSHSYPYSIAEKGADVIHDDEMQEKDEAGYIEKDEAGYIEDAEANTAVIHDELQNVLPVDDGDTENLMDTESKENIFKVWEFESPDEEDELMQQLKKLVSETRLKLQPPAATGDPVTNVAMKEDIDELTAVMADLSFRETKD